MHTAQVEALRALLAPTGWLERTRHFTGALRRRAKTPHGLLIVGTPSGEPWHMTAHLADESRLAGLPELMPTLVRWAPPAGAPPHLAVGIDRLERAGRAETVLVVSAESAPPALLDRVADARKAGTAIFALDAGDPDLGDLAAESLVVRPGQDPISFDAAQHLVSFGVAEPAEFGSDDLLTDMESWPQAWHLPASRMRAAGTQPAAKAGVRGRLNRLLGTISGPPPD